MSVDVFIDHTGEPFRVGRLHSAGRGVSVITS
jgi:hypothetical protein